MSEQSKHTNTTCDNHMRIKMNKTLSILSIIVLTATLGVSAVQEADALIHLDRSVGINGDSYVAATYKDIQVIDYDLYRSQIDVTGTTKILLDIHNFKIHVSLEPTDRHPGIYHPDLAVFTIERFNELNQPIVGKDSNAAPSMGGLSNHENKRYHFTNVVDQPTFGTTCTEISIYNGFATSRHVGVYLDGWPIGSIDLGRDLNEGEVLGFGGQQHPVPFEKCFYVTPEGQLIIHGAGYQNVHRDLNGMRTFNEDQAERTIIQQTLTNEMALSPSISN